MASDDSGRSVESTNPSPEIPPPTPAAQAGAGKVKTRSPVERAIVRSGIILLLILVFIEWRASSGLTADSEAVHEAMQKAEKGYLTESELDALMTRYSHRESQRGLTANEIAASRVDVFRYGGVLKKRILYVYFGLPRPGHEQEVIQIGELPIRMYSPEDFGFRPHTDDAEEASDSAKDSAAPEGTGEIEEVAPADDRKDADAASTETQSDSQ